MSIPPAQRVSKLTVRQQKLCDAYLVNGGNGKQAAIAAGYSEKSAASAGNRALRDVNVVKYLAEHARKATAESQLTREWIIKRYMQLASADVRKLYRDDGSMKLPHELDDETAYGIAGMETESRNLGNDADGNPVSMKTHKIKRWEPTKALDGLAKILKLFGNESEGGDKTTVVIKGGLPDA